MDSVVETNEPQIDLQEILVSVVIPTRGRPHLLKRAVRSALKQSFRHIEVIVVIDGYDPESEAALSHVTDERLRVVCLPQNLGGSEARNVGVRHSRSKWIAFLDDDDEWLPGKLAIQWRAAESVVAPYVLIASRFIERTEAAERVLPRRRPALGEPFSEYLFARRGWHSGETFLQTSTWFVSRELMTQRPFSPGLKRCQDLDWLLNAAAIPETKIVIVPEVLAIFHHGEHGVRVSREADWRFLYEWARANRHLFTAKAYSFFIATFCAPSAAKQRVGIRAPLFLLLSCFAEGYPGGKCLVLFLMCWWVPEELRRSLRTSTNALSKIAAAARPSTPGEYWAGNTV